eukprot:12868278-Alexandrium_andersonii.AAC.1
MYHGNAKQLPRAASSSQVGVGCRSPESSGQIRRGPESSAKLQKVRKAPHGSEGLQRDPRA